MDLISDLRPAAPHEAARSHRHAGGEFLTFRLGDEEYGIDILRVQEIRSCEQPTRIANVPAFVKGVVNLRGVVDPVSDVLELPPEAIRPAPEMASAELGLIETTR